MSANQSFVSIQKLPNNSSKFYPQSLTLLVQILKMINEDFILTKIAKVLNKKKSHVTYYISKAKERGYVNEVLRDKIKILELTQKGKNLLDQYDKKKTQDNQLPSCRAENIRFEAVIHRLPSKSVDWQKVNMNNWNQYNSTVDNIRVHLNMGKSPSIEFIPQSN
jgi:DNA-binding MarR family transcriptional regulator